jgi:hypothetical protein
MRRRRLKTAVTAVRIRSATAVGRESAIEREAATSIVSARRRASAPPASATTSTHAYARSSSRSPESPRSGSYAFPIEFVPGGSAVGKVRGWIEIRRG